MELTDLPVETPSNSWRQSQPIVIDLGSYHTRVGMASSDVPTHSFPSYSAKWRDKHTSENQLVVGAEAVEQTARSTIKPLYDGGFLANWDVFEHVLDYSFELLGVTSEGFVDSPVVISDHLASPHTGRQNVNEILFEGYGVPKLGICVDSLAAYRHAANDRQGFGIHFGNEATLVTPFGQGSLSDSRRLNWGGRQASDFMQALMALKYPFFPQRLSVVQAGQMVRECCYVAQDYTSELTSFLDIKGLESRERIIQFPSPAGREEPSKAQLEAQLERRRESGRRLREQAIKAREEKQQRLKTELDVLLRIQEEGSWEDEYPSEEALEAEISILRRSINPSDAEEEAPPATTLVDIPDTELTPDQVKEKRKQKLQKANYDARMKIKAEKLEKAQEIERARAADEEWRQRDLDDWIKTKRAQLFQLRDAIREKRRLRRELNDRKSLASKLRMKSIVLLASGDSNKKRKLKDQDEFGDNENDWKAYNDVTDEEDEEDQEDKLRLLQQELLEHDPSFSLDEMHERIDWKKSTIHKFLYGAHQFEKDSVKQAYQLNVNVERIRVPEVLFQPSINGIDQAGISEILGDVLKLFPQKNPYICLTGGLANLPGLASRIQRDVQTVLPWGTNITVDLAENPSLAAWQGMAKESESDIYCTKQEYEEWGRAHGKNYMLRQHSLSNLY